MPSLPRAVRPLVRARPLPAPRPVPRVVVLGDLVLDVVLAPNRPLAGGSDVSGRVSLRQGGSAATTARWLARLGTRSSLITSVGRDPIGRALVDALVADGVAVRAIRVAGLRTGRIGVFVAPDGERSFVADRAAADALRADDVRGAWLAGIDLLHLPVYSLLGDPLGTAGQAAIDRVRTNGALVSLDLASVQPLLSGGRRAARALVREAGPDVLFATAEEAKALLGPGAGDDLLRHAPIAVVKRGSLGATVLARPRPGSGVVRFEVASRPLAVADTTGAGDAFDAGFIASWLAAPPDERDKPSVLRRAALAGNRAAARQLSGPHPELDLG